MAFVRQLLLAFTVALCLASAAEMTFTADRFRISAGESATLSWQATPTQKTVLLGTGEVVPSGSMQISPTSTSSYTLVSDGPEGFSARTVTVEVTGARGAYFPSDEEQYRYPLSDQRTVHSRGDFLQEIFRLLQNDLAFSVRTYTAGNGVVIFLTNAAERGDLVTADERRRIRARRISFRLEVADRADQLAYTIKSLIEFQLRAEETWRKESQETWYQQKGRELLNRLASLP
jgi:hypothetical protein